MTTVSPKLKSLVEARLQALECSLFGTGYNPLDDYVCWFITLNTKISKYEDFKKTVALIQKKIRSKQLCTCAFQYSFEYFTAGSNHLHCHIQLFKLKKEKRLGKKSFIKHFFIPAIMEGIEKVDVRSSLTKKILNNRFKYVTGSKKHQDYVDKDRELFSNFSIAPIYRFALNPHAHRLLNIWLQNHD